MATPKYSLCASCEENDTDVGHPGKVSSKTARRERGCGGGGDEVGAGGGGGGCRDATKI